MNDIETAETGGTTEAELSAARRTIRWLIVGIIMLIVAFAGLGVWFKIDTDGTIDEAQTALAETRDSLSTAEGEAADLEREVNGLKQDIGDLEADINRLDADLAGRESELADIESDVTTFMSAMLEETSPMSSSDAGCIAETLVDQGDTSQLLVGLAEAAQNPGIGSPLLQTGPALFEAAEFCGVSPTDTFGEGSVSIVASQLATTGYFVDPSSDVSDQEVADAVADARSGGTLYIVVLAYEPTGGTIAFSDAILDQLGSGYVFTIGTATVGYAGDGSSWSSGEMDAAVEASLEGVSDAEVVRLFVEKLAG